MEGPNPGVTLKPLPSNYISENVTWNMESPNPYAISDWLQALPDNSKPVASLCGYMCIYFLNQSNRYIDDLVTLI